MAVATTVSAGANICTPDPRPSMCSALILAAAGMTQRWRQQTVASCRLLRANRARLQAEASRREAASRRKQRDRLPHASAARGVATLQMMAAENAALAHDARATGRAEAAATHEIDAAWFQAEATRRAAFLAIFPEV